MNVAAGPELAAAVSNNGGLGVIGGVGYTPEFLKEQIDELKKGLASPDLPFGVDLVSANFVCICEGITKYRGLIFNVISQLLPKVGAGARKTNYDYTKGNKCRGEIL